MNTILYELLTKCPYFTMQSMTSFQFRYTPIASNKFPNFKGDRTSIIVNQHANCIITATCCICLETRTFFKERRTRLD